MKRTTKPKAPWVSAFPAQAKRLHPEHTKAGGVKVRSTPESIRMEIYNAIRELFLSRPKNKLCFVCHAPDQGMPATEIHHMKGREGWLLVDVRYWLPVCAECHRFIHDHPAEATKLGLLLKR